MDRVRARQPGLRRALLVDVDGAVEIVLDLGEDPAAATAEDEQPDAAGDRTVC